MGFTCLHTHSSVDKILQTLVHLSASCTFKFFTRDHRIRCGHLNTSIPHVLSGRGVTPPPSHNTSTGPMSFPVRDWIGVPPRSGTGWGTPPTSGTGCGYTPPPGPVMLRQVMPWSVRLLRFPAGGLSCWFIFLWQLYLLKSLTLNATFTSRFNLPFNLWLVSSSWFWKSVCKTSISIPLCSSAFLIQTTCERRKKCWMQWAACTLE